jgi:hypothetical protein
MTQQQNRQRNAKPMSNPENPRPPLPPFDAQTAAQSAHGGDA